MSRLAVTIAGETHTVKLGAFSQIAAKRRSYDGIPGIEALKAGDPEALLYATWIELVGPRPKNESRDFEDPNHPFNAWLRTVENFQLAEEGPEDDEDPTEAESSAPSPVSPPTSE